MPRWVAAHLRFAWHHQQLTKASTLSHCTPATALEECKSFMRAAGDLVEEELKHKAPHELTPAAELSHLSHIARVVGENNTIRAAALLKWSTLAQKYLELNGAQVNLREPRVFGDRIEELKLARILKGKH